MNRAHLLEQAAGASDPFDVLIIGGGATGLGVAVDAAARGYRTVLLEQHDFAKATSSRSTKLIHGGFRYLKQGNLSLVRESLHERGLLLRNAPHLVHAQAFIVPAYSLWEKIFYGTGLKIYDVLAGSLGLGHTTLLSREETLRQLPTAKAEGLAGGDRYFDGQFDDARLAICLAQTCVDFGGVPLNYVRVERLLQENDRVRGVIARDGETNREFTVRAKVVVNATGVFTDAIRRLEDAHAVPMMAASQGVHIVLDRSFLPGNNALMVPKTKDGRVLFGIPWHDRAVIGTTDTPVTETSLEPRPLAEEIEFLLEHAALYLAKAPSKRDILSTFAGLRPLVKSGGTKSTAKLSRDHVLVVSPGGLITITGGKWTTYRKMAEDTVNEAIKVGGLAFVPCNTGEKRLHGAPSANAQPSATWNPYGTDLPQLEALISARPALNDALHPRLPYRAGEVVWAARHEMALTVEDVLSRRTRALLLDAKAASETAPQVAALLTEELKRSPAWQQEQVAAFQKLAADYLVA